MAIILKNVSFVEKFLLNNTKYKLLILSKENTKIKERQKISNQISVKWLNTNDVIPFKNLCYGLIIRMNY